MAEPFVSGLPPLHANAWTGEAAPTVTLAPGALAWATSLHFSEPASTLLKKVPRAARDWNWRSNDVGWGVVLPDDDTLPQAQRARADDAPVPIQRLVAARGQAPVVRWRPAPGGIGKVVRYDEHGKEWPLELNSPTGIEPWELPRFLLICAPPDVIPWTFQYAANLQHHVGRLWLPEAALARYVDALLSGWAGSACDTRKPLLWSVDHGEPDITWLMDRAIIAPLAAKLAADDDLRHYRHLAGAEATHGQLLSALQETKPGLVVATSHGMTGPLSEPETMAAQLGLPVDAQHRVLDLQALCSQWQPDGAIWYSHACCAAGSDSASAYQDLVDRGYGVGRQLAGVADGCGARIAPLPQALLGAERPARAFIGHVEPTFDWTLRDPSSGQPLTHSLVKALYNRLFEDGGPRPVGWALAEVFTDVSTPLFEWTKACEAARQNVPGSAERALYYQIAALDRMHTVILGDPTAALAWT